MLPNICEQVLLDQTRAGSIVLLYVAFSEVRFDLFHPCVHRIRFHMMQPKQTYALCYLVAHSEDICQHQLRRVVIRFAQPVQIDRLARCDLCSVYDLFLSASSRTPTIAMPM